MAAADRLAAVRNAAGSAGRLRTAPARPRDLHSDRRGIPASDTRRTSEWPAAARCQADLSFPDLLLAERRRCGLPRSPADRGLVAAAMERVNAGGGCPSNR